MKVVSWSKSIMLTLDYSRSGIADRNQFKISMLWIKNHLSSRRGQLCGSSVNIAKFRAECGKRWRRRVLAVAFRGRSLFRHSSLQREVSLEKEAETPAIVTSRVVCQDSRNLWWRLPRIL